MFNFRDGIFDNNRLDPIFPKGADQFFMEPAFIFKNAANPNAALLFIEHQASPEGQKVLDEAEPMKSSVFTDGEVSKILKGKKVSLNDFRTYAKTESWMKMVLEAYGFPKPEIR